MPAATADDDARPVADLTETELISRFAPLLPVGSATVVPTGDDAAVIAAPDRRYVVSTDVLVEGLHFRHGWGDARDVGARAAAQNLADIAAMGAVPRSMVVGLVLPPDTTVSWVLDLARGLADVCAPLGVGVDGGDLSAGDQLVVAVTVHGDLEGRDPVLRSGARPGDVLAHAGVLGRAAAGLAVLSAANVAAARHSAVSESDSTDAVRGSTGAAASEPDPTGVVRDATGAGESEPPTEADFPEGPASAVIDAFLRPSPPYAAGPSAALAGATAMMDVSDGLLRDADRLARASGVVLSLDPVAQTSGADLELVTPLAARLGQDPVSWLLTGGEDHGMLATFPPEVPLPDGFRRIGAVLAPDGGPGVITHDALAPGSPGWDHFRRGHP